MERAPSPHDRLIRKLESIATLSVDDRSAILRLPLRERHLAPSEEIVLEGDRPAQCCLLIHGFMHRYKILQDGTRAVLAFHIPGEIPDFESLFLPTLDHSIGAVTACEVAMIPHAPVHELIRERPAIMAVFWRETLIDAAIFREWIVNTGARTARARLAHFFAEMFERLRSVGLAESDGFAFPITQITLGNATGLSTVHVNRTLQWLRAEKLIATKDHCVRILDWPRLQKVAGYESRYLHMNQAETDGETRGSDSLGRANFVSAALVARRSEAVRATETSR